MPDPDNHHSSAPPERDGEFRSLGRPVPPSCEGMRVDAYLSRYFAFLSRAGWQKRIRCGEVFVSGVRVRPSSRLRAGDKVRFFHDMAIEPEVDTNLRVLWQDGPVMAVFKPAPMAMHQNGPYRFHTFARLLKEQVGEEWAAVHRIDLETSGLVLCGATAKARADLARDFLGGGICKEYKAIVRGLVEPERQSVDAPIGDLAESEIRIKNWVVEHGDPAQTVIEVKDRAAEATLIHAYPRTGRTHQIRVHAAYLGHELLGDKLYHPDEAVFLEYYEKGATDWVIRRAGFPRLCLHAFALEFRHPESGLWERVEAPLAPDMVEGWNELKLQSKARP